jgi:hypothetical protein
VFLERLGHYDPLTDPADIVIDEEKALKWLRRGAQPTDTAKRLLSKRGILMKFEYEKLGKPMPETAVDAEVAEVAKTDDPQPADAQEVDEVAETDGTQEAESETGNLPDEAASESAEEEE